MLPPALTVPAVAMLPPVTVPVTLKLLRVPTDVMLGCALVYTVPATRALPTCPVTLPPVIELKPEPLPLTFPASTLPVTLTELSVPTLVMLGCAAVLSVPATVVNVPLVPLRLPPVILPVALTVPAVATLPPVMVPVALTVPAVSTLPPVMVPVALTVPAVAKLPPVTVPVTLKLDNVPTDVMLGCAAVLSVPATVVNAPSVALTLPLSTLPVTLTLVSVPTDVMLGCAAVYTVPATSALPT